MTFNEWATTIVVGVGALSAIALLVRRLWGFARLSVHAFETIVGTPDKPDKPGSGKPGLADRLTEVEKQLKANGGGSVRDVVVLAAKEARVAAAAVERVEGSVAELHTYAKANREGISDLRDQANDLSRRLTDVDEKADALGARQTDHRRRNDDTISDLKQFIEEKYADAVMANEGLRASVTELLNIDERKQT